MPQEIKHIQFENIDIFSFKITDYLEQIPQLSSSLTTEELKRANRFYFEKDTNCYIVCRSLLRSILSEKLQINPSKILLDYNGFGKPEISKSQNNREIQFNISHSGLYGLIGITTQTPIGVDIEEIKSTVSKGEILKSQFNTQEYTIFKKSNEKDLCFFNIWTQKEAVIKASGEGFSFGLKNWSTNPDQSSYELEAKSLKFSVKKLEIDNNYCAAFAILK